MFHISVLPSTFYKMELVEQQEITDLLQEYADIFEEPKSLPPHRHLDHEIHLLPNSALVNVIPYRYPHFQKKKKMILRSR